MNDDICLSCHKVFSEKDSVVCCVECGTNYHLGDCSGTRTKRTNWKCPTCRTYAQRTVASSATDKVNTREDQSSFAKRLEVSTQTSKDEALDAKLDMITRMLTGLMPIQSKIDDLLEMKATVQNLELSVQVMSDKYDDLLAQLAEQNSDIKELKKKVRVLEETKVNMDDLMDIKSQLNDLDQYGRRNTIEIHGIPLENKEDLELKLEEIAVVLGIPSPIGSVEAVHRLPTKPDKIPPVIVKFANRKTRDTWMAKKKEMSNLQFQNRRIFFNENLTAINRQLYYQLRMKAKEAGYLHVWSKYGALYARKRDGDKPVRVFSVLDLEKIK